MRTGVQETFVGKGLNIDTHEHLLDDKDIYYLSNGDIQGYENGGNDVFVQNTLSNELCFQKPSNYEYSGSIKLDKEQHLLFFKTPIGDEIGLFDADKCTYVVLTRKSCFNFNPDYPIRGVFKYKNNCNSRRAYFTDNLNPIRYFDIDECWPKAFEDCTDCTSPEVDKDCNELNVFPCITYPEVEITQTNGNLPNGVYQIAIAPADGDIENANYYIYPTLLRFHTNLQAVNRFGISIKIKNCINYDRYKVVLISHRTDRATLAQEIGIYDYTQNAFTISELDETNYKPLDLRILLANKTYYKTAKHIVNNDETLILADVKERDRINYQIKANSIKSNWVVKRIKGKYAHLHPSFMRGEVYAFYINGVYCDGSRTPKFHIPSDAERRIKEYDAKNGTDNWTLYTSEPPETADYFEKNDNCEPQTKKFWELYDTSLIDLPECEDLQLACKKFAVTFQSEEGVEYYLDFTDCKGNERRLFYTGIGGSSIVKPCSSNVSTIKIINSTNNEQINTSIVETNGDCDTERPGSCNPCLANTCDKYTFRHGLYTNDADPLGMGPYHAIYIDCNGEEQRISNFKADVTEICIKSIIESNIKIYHTPSNELADDTPSGDKIGECEVDLDCEYCVTEGCDGCTVYKGRFAYWHSTLQYPNNPCVWGQRNDPDADFYDTYGLSCENVRYHKFPENCRTHIHESTGCGQEEYVNILGIEFENIPSFDDPDIIGYEISVAKREGQESILHKGLLYNMWEESLADCSSSFYANYPFNDLRDDVFLGQEQVFAGDTARPADDDGFNPVPTEWHSRTKFQYISPDVSYVKNDSGQYLQVYTEENGILDGQYGLVEDFPKVVFMNSIVDFLMTIVAVVVGVSGIFGGAFYQIIDVANTMLNTLRNTLPPVNYALYYLARSRYNKWNCYNVNIGNIRRKINFSQYLIPTKQYAGNTKINNYQRESGLYLDIDNAIDDPYVPERSRILMSDNDCKSSFSGCNLVGGKEVGTSSYYAGVKVYKPNQYNYPEDNITRTISGILKGGKTGFLEGGDIFITKHKMVRKMPFFTKLPIGLPDGSMFETSPYFNVQKPRFWMDADDNKTIFAVIKEISGIGALLPSMADTNRYNFDTIGKFNNTSCFTEAADCIKEQYIGGGVQDLGKFLAEKIKGNDVYFLQHNGKFYAYVLGIAEYWAESKFISDFREYNEIPQSNVNRDDLEIANYKTVLYPELFLYNLQFLWDGIFNVTTHSSRHLDCCDLKAPCNTNKLIYSLKNDPLRGGDAWLNFRPNSFQQFDMKDGQLTFMKGIDDNNLMIGFEDGVYVTQQEDSLTSDSGNRIYLGSPDLFSRRLRKITDDTTGFGGCLDPDSVQVTRYGVFWFDRKRKKFIRYSGQITDETGPMQSWMQKNLDGEIIGVYDNFTDNLYFTQKTIKNSWTISYKPKNNRFISFHSFIPDNYLQMSNNYITLKDGNLWRHNNVYDYQRYYGTLYPFDIGVVLKDKFNTMVNQDIKVYTEWLRQNEEGCKIYDFDIFFNKFFAYNHIASTGVRDLLLKDMSNSNHYLIQNRSDIVEVTGEEDFEFKVNKFTSYQNSRPFICFKGMNYTITEEKIKERPLRGKWMKLHFISDKTHEHKILFQIVVGTNEEVKK